MGPADNWARGVRATYRQRVQALNRPAPRDRWPYRTLGRRVTMLPLLLGMIVGMSAGARAETQPPSTTPANVPIAGDLPLTVGSRGPLVARAQGRLIWLGAEIADQEVEEQRFGPSTRRAVNAFQVKFFGHRHGRVGTGTWHALRRIAGRVGELPEQCQRQRTICVDMNQKLLRLVSDGNVLLTLDARFGMPGYATAQGTFRVQRKSRNHVSSLYRTRMPFALFFNGGQAVHYSPYFHRDGYLGGSHGCINLRDFRAAEWLFDRVPVGTRVFIYP